MLKLPFSLALCCATCLAIPALAANSLNPDILETPAIEDDTAVDFVPGDTGTDTDISEEADEEASSEESNDITDIEDSIGSANVLLTVACRSTDCAALGYSTSEVDGCTKYIKCPFDTSYQICSEYNRCTKETSSVGVRVRQVIVDELAVSEALLCDSANLKTDLGADSLALVGLRMALEKEFDRDIPDVHANNMATVKDIIDFFSTDEYTLSVCPEGAVCTGKFKITECNTGYTLQNNTCVANSTCSSGYELGTIYGTTTQKCYKTACGKLGLTAGVAQYATFSNGYKVVISCSSGYTASTDLNGCTSCKVSLNFNTCPTGCTTGMVYNSGSLTVCCDSSGFAPDGSMCMKCTSSLSPDGLSCQIGTYSTPTEACKNCSYGYRQATSNRNCYECCTSSDGSISCLKCLSSSGPDLIL